MNVSTDKQLVIENAIRDILDVLCAEEERPNIDGTPNRVARAILELTEGYHQDPDKIINRAYYKTDHHDVVMVRNIQFASLCSHHMMPFICAVNVAYLPNEWLIGLSKIPRIVKLFARRLQIQEHLTYQIAHLLQEKLNPLGVAVMIEANHTCSQIRGVQDCSSKMLTKCFLGKYEEDVSLRQEFILDCYNKPGLSKVLKSI